MSPPGQATIIRRKKRRRRRRAPVFPFVFLALLLIGGLVGIRLLLQRRPMLSKASLPAGYIAEINVLEQEYAKFFGAKLEEDRISARFQQAGEAASKGNMAGATSVLEGFVKTLGLPVAYHDLGLGYAALGDYTRAADAFREVLARDSEYTPTRKFLRETKNIGKGAAEPYTREFEPNNDSASANLIAVGAPVGGEIAGSNDPADYFKFVAPASPRDIVRIELSNHSINFAPRLRVYDDKLRILSWGDSIARAGESITVAGGPAVNSVLYIAVSAEDAAGGVYLLTVKPVKAFDKYEPNDDLTSARRISVGDEISANVMDAADSDFFSFQSPRRGALTIDVQNRSQTLIPALTMYNGDRRNLGFAQEVRKPGSNIRYVLDAEKDAVYYIQISSQAGSFGAYTLRVD